MIRIINKIGKWSITFSRSIGCLCIFIFFTLSSFIRTPWYPKLILRQCIFIGFYSLPVVAMTSIFSGAVLALQSYTGLARLSAESSIATIVVISITRELGPVLAGLMVAARVGASIAAEIATMRVTEQIDALHTLSIDPIQYLVFPRMIAAALMLPMLVLIGDILGVMGGYLVSVYKLGFNHVEYITNTFKHLKFIDVISGLTKAVIFGFVIAVMSAYSGYNAHKGARGVGNATTIAVVNSAILIFISNYLVTELFFSK